MGFNYKGKYRGHVHSKIKSRRDAHPTLACQLIPDVCVLLVWSINFKARENDVNKVPIYWEHVKDKVERENDEKKR